MKVDLLPHNEEAYEKIREAIADGKKKIAVSHATGSGKSYLISKLCEDFSDDKKLVLVPSKYIKEEIQKLFVKYGIKNVEVVLYQKLINMDDHDITAMEYSIIILDEYHHDTSKVWGVKVRMLIDTHPESLIFGTSATPVRSDGVNTIDELFEGNCISDMPLSACIAKKIVPLPKYVGALYTLDNELEVLRKKIEKATNSKEEKKEYYKKINAMRSQIEKSYGMPIILNKHIKDREGKYIIFCKNKRHLKEIMETVIGWFRTAGCKNINSYVVHSSYEKKDAEYRAFCDDTSHSLKLLFCVDMLNEGLHLKNISGVLLLRPTRSSIVWHQQIGRAIEANNTKTPVVIDAVNNFSSVGKGMELMEEIREAVSREKESNPNFDDSGFLDIDTFFVTEQVREVQELFAEIEERLQGSWDLYIKALEQYKERVGDCLVPSGHVEAVDGVNVKLGQWCINIRASKKGRGRYLLTKERDNKLNELGFIWDIPKYRFEKNVADCIAFYDKNGKLPSNKSKDEKERKLMQSIFQYKYCISSYPQWKQELLKKIPTLFDDKFDKFYEMVLLYKQRYGHVDIKFNDIIDGYNIGIAYSSMIKKFENEKLTFDQVKRLKEIDIDIIKRKFQKRFQKNLQLANKALGEGVVITFKNPIYQGVNLYKWYRDHKDKLSEEELIIMKKLIPNQENKKVVNIIDLGSEKKYTYTSISEAGYALYSEFHVVDDEKQGRTVIMNRLTGHTKNPIYKGFRFEYADNESGDNKAS